MKDTAAKRSAALLSAMLPEVKRRSLLAVCAILLAGVLVLAGCDNGTTDDDSSGSGGGKTFPAEMIGTWTKAPLTMIIESGKMTLDDEVYVVYSVSGKTIKVSPEGYDNWYKLCTDWSVTGNALALSGSDYATFDGTWTK
jgi:hypothetical protein